MTHHAPTSPRPFDTSDLPAMIDWYDRLELAYAALGHWQQAARCAWLGSRLEILDQIAHAA